jgi:hypothetical protein
MRSNDYRLTDNNKETPCVVSWKSEPCGLTIFPLMRFHRGILAVKYYLQVCGLSRGCVYVFVCYWSFELRALCL